MNKYTETDRELHPYQLPVIKLVIYHTYPEWKSLVPPFFTSLYMRWSVCTSSNIKLFSNALFESFRLDN